MCGEEQMSGGATQRGSVYEDSSIITHKASSTTVRRAGELAAI